MDRACSRFIFFVLLVRLVQTVVVALPDAAFPQPGSAAFANLCGADLTQVYPASIDHRGSVRWVRSHNTGEGIAQYMDVLVSQLLLAVRNHEAFYVTWDLPAGGTDPTQSIDPSQIFESPYIDLRPDSTSDLGTCTCYTCFGNRRTSQQWECGMRDNGPGIFRSLYDHSKLNSPLMMKRIHDYALRSLNNLPQESQLFLSTACALNFVIRPTSTLLERRDPGKLVAELTNRAETETLVIGIYIRTNRANSFANERGAPKTEWTYQIHNPGDEHAYLEGFFKCAIQIESDWRSDFKRVLWLVASDNSDLKWAAVEQYTAADQSPPRLVRASETLGLHTSSHVNSDPDKEEEFIARAPNSSMQRAAEEAFLDWWLLGEVDFLVVDQYSGTYWQTGAARTARLDGIYDRKICAPFVGPHVRRKMSSYRLAAASASAEL